MNFHYFYYWNLFDYCLDHFDFFLSSAFENHHFADHFYHFDYYHFFDYYCYLSYFVEHLSDYYPGYYFVLVNLHYFANFHYFYYWNLVDYCLDHFDFFLSSVFENHHFAEHFYHFDYYHFFDYYCFSSYFAEHLSDYYPGYYFVLVNLHCFVNFHYFYYWNLVDYCLDHFDFFLSSVFENHHFAEHFYHFDYYHFFDYYCFSSYFAEHFYHFDYYLFFDDYCYLSYFADFDVLDYFVDFLDFAVFLVIVFRIVVQHHNLLHLLYRHHLLAFLNHLFLKIDL